MTNKELLIHSAEKSFLAKGSKKWWAHRPISNQRAYAVAVRMLTHHECRPASGDGDMTDDGDYSCWFLLLAAEFQGD